MYGVLRKNNVFFSKMKKKVVFFKENEICARRVRKGCRAFLSQKKLTDRGDIAVVWGVAVVMKMVGKRWGEGIWIHCATAGGS